MRRPHIPLLALVISVMFFGGLAGQGPPRYDREEPHAICRSVGSGWLACDAISVWDPRKGANGVEWSVATSGGQYIQRGLRITFRPVGNVIITLHARGREVVVHGDPSVKPCPETSTACADPLCLWELKRGEP